MASVSGPEVKISICGAEELELAVFARNAQNFGMGLRQVILQSLFRRKLLAALLAICRTQNIRTSYNRFRAFNHNRLERLTRPSALFAKEN